jgi:hypothetical protein
VTIVDSPTERSIHDEVQLLFQEARHRRRRRWLISGIVASILLAVVGFTLNATLGHRSSGSLPSLIASSSAKPAGALGGAFSIRPVLCYAPPPSLAAGQSALTGPLPTCAPASELTATNLGVEPDPNNVNGYTSNSNIPIDPKFAGYQSTSPADANLTGTVLLPAWLPNQGGDRYVLGQAGLTRSAVKSARAQLINNQWAINITFTSEGSVEWDTMAQQQFHALIGIEIGGKVVSAPITQPSQVTFSSFNGHMQITGGFNEQQAKTLAAEL